MKENTGKASMAYMTALALLGWFALILQLYLIIERSTSNGIHPLQAIINYFSYFTILTNLIVAVSLTICLILPHSMMGKYFSRPSIKTGITLHIVIVGIIYSLLLRKIWNPQGMQLVADRILHDLVPLLYFFYWLLFVPKGSLKWKDMFSWLIYPAVYLLYVLLLGYFSGNYPYPFIDVNTLGYGGMLLNAAGMLLAFAATGLLLIAIGRIFSSRQPSL